MPLVPSILSQALTDLGNNQGTPEDAAKKMAQSYQDYAGGALAGGGTPILIGQEKAVIESSLLGVLKNTNGVIASYAAAWFSSILSFWTPVIWQPPGPTFGPGVLTVPPAATIQTGLIAQMSSSNEVAAWANKQATTIHTGVAGIMIITFPPIPPNPAPLVAPVA